MEEVRRDGGRKFNNLTVRFLRCCEADEVIEILDDGAWRSVVTRPDDDEDGLWQNTYWNLAGPEGATCRVFMLRGAHPRSVPPPWMWDDGGLSRVEDLAAFGPQDAARRMALIKEWGEVDDGYKWKWKWDKDEQWDEVLAKWVVPGAAVEAAAPAEPPTVMTWAPAPQQPLPPLAVAKVVTKVGRR